jgi:hypothetical protein
MAGLAGIGLHAQMVEARPEKSNGIGMAHLARAIGHNMITRFPYSHHAAPRRMATGTGGGRALEDTAGVTGFALDSDMHPGQRKAGGGMIEAAARLRPGLRMCCCGKYQQCNQQQEVHRPSQRPRLAINDILFHDDPPQHYPDHSGR